MMLKLYLIGVGVSLLFSFLANYKWNKTMRINRSFMTPATLCLIPIIQWLWTFTCIVTVVADDRMLEKASKKKKGGE